MMNITYYHFGSRRKTRSCSEETVIAHTILTMIWTLIMLVASSSCLEANYQYTDRILAVESSEFENISRILNEGLPGPHILEGPSLSVPTDPEMERLRGASDLLYPHIEEMLEGPYNTVKEINTVGFNGIASHIHEKISFLYAKLYTYFIRAYMYASGALYSGYKAIRGNICYPFPNIENFFKIFTLIGGEICPFDDFETQNVTVKDALDGNWVVELPVVMKKVKVVFSSVQVYSPLLSTPAWTFQAKDVQVKLSFGMTKSLIPYPNSVDLKVKVQGCDVSDPNSNWILRKLMKLSAKICDPILNEIIKVSLIVAKVDLKIFAWFAKMVFKGDLWMYTMAKWVLKHLQKLIRRKLDYTS